MKRKLLLAVAMVLGVGAAVAASTRYAENRALDFMALTYASEKGHEVLVRGLLNRGTPVDPPPLGPSSAEYLASQFQTPLDAAAEAGHADLVALLLKAGADPNHQCCSGETSLWSAVDAGHLHVVKLLLEGGADPTLQSASGSPLDHAVALGRSKIENLIRVHIADE